MKKTIALLLCTVLLLALCACAKPEEKPAENQPLPIEKLVEDAKTGSLSIDTIKEGDELDLSAYSAEDREQVKNALTDQGVELKESDSGKLTVVTVPETPATPDNPDGPDTPDNSGENTPGVTDSDEELHIDVIPDNPDE